MRTIVVSGLILLLVALQAWATRMPVHDAAESPAYGTKFGGMIGRGVINVATCFVDLLVNTVNETRTGPPLVGTLVGLGRGVGCTTLRAFSGGVDLLTFWVPGFNGFPVSDSYDSCLTVMPGSASQVVSPQPTVPGKAPAAESVSRPFGPAPTVTAPPKEEKPRYTK